MRSGAAGRLRLPITTQSLEKGGGFSWIDIANFKMLIFQFALICEKKYGQGANWHRRTHPRGKIVEDISMARMFPKGMDALSPALFIVK